MSKNICFVGSDYKVGVTSTVQSIGEALAQALPERKVLILHLDGNEGQEYTLNKGQSIDIIRSTLVQGLATWEEVESLLDRKENLYSLGGAENILDKALYAPEASTNLINLCSDRFDYILIDAGSDIENPLSIGACIYPCEKVIVTTQQAKAQKVFQQKKTAVFDKLGIAFDNLIINRFTFASGNFLRTEKELETFYVMEEAFLIPTVPVSWQSEADEASIYSYNKKEFRSNLLVVIEKIVATEDDALLFKKGKKR